MPGEVLFISDLHLAPETPGATRLFLRFLDETARSAAALYILGDLFDAWAGDDDLDDPFNVRITGGLRRLAESGVPVAFLPGNRDFLVGKEFSRAAGVEILTDPCVRAIDGEDVLLTHGDALCTDDADYQQFRATVRSDRWQEEFLSRPLAERKRDIARLRARSEAEKGRKPLAVMDVSRPAVLDALDRNRCRLLVHGHTHRRGEERLAYGTRLVLGDWNEENGNALALDKGERHWIEIR